MLIAKDPVSSYPWGLDALSEFLKLSEQNTFASSANLGPEYARLVAIHRLWIEVAEAFHVAADSDLLGIWFLHQANSAWLAAIRVGLGGQPIDAQPLFRSCLEYAAYALHFTRHPSLKETWIRRHDDAVAKDTARKSFSARKVATTVKQESQRMADRYERLYDAAIDFGGHPNERALSARLNLKREAGANVSSVTRLTDDPKQYLFLARSAARAGVLALELFSHVFETRFRVASFDVKLKELQRGL